MDELDKLTDYEREELQKLLGQYHDARNMGNLDLAECHLGNIREWDSSLGILKDGIWTPFFEERRHLLGRIYERVKRFNRAVKPFHIDQHGDLLSAERCLELVAYNIINQ